MTRTKIEIPCGACGVALTDAELAFLWSDQDFMDHGDHYASVAEADREEFYGRFRSGRTA